MNFIAVMRKMRRVVITGAFIIGAVAGCALPEAAPLPASVPTEAPPVVPVRAEGRLLSPAEAGPVLAALAREGSTDLLRRHLSSALGSVDSPLVLGNQAKLLIDGPQTHKAMLAAIRGARNHVNLQSYIITDDEVGLKLAELLRTKRKQGVRVNVMYDSVGGLDTPKEYFDGLRADGIAVCEFNPVNPLKAKGDWRVNNRNHRKLLIVDGVVGFTGGINISGVYSTGSFGSGTKSPEQGWRDTHVRFEGPVVREAQKLFLNGWRSQEHCPAVETAHYYPSIEKRGARVMRLMASTPDQGSETYATLLSALHHAERSADLTYGYFVPDQRTLDTLKDAARRGVEVKLLLPAFSDFWAPLYAGRSRYADLLESGVRIYERKDALLHAKTAVIDGVWSTVGSTNLDWRSFVHNYEADLVVLGDDFGAEMSELFAADLARSHEITLDAWRKRGISERLKEFFARQWEYWL